MAAIKIVPTGDLNELRKKHERFMEENEDYRKATESLTFKKGQKLLVEVEITEEWLSDSLMMLLFDKIEGAENLGFKVTTINLNNVHADRQRFIERLEKMVEELKNPFSY
jgi:uncharacterized protein YceH (UPF0502 family)